MAKFKHHHQLFCVKKAILVLVSEKLRGPCLSFKLRPGNQPRAPAPAVLLKPAGVQLGNRSTSGALVNRHRKGQNKANNKLLKFHLSMKSKQNIKFYKGTNGQDNSNAKFLKQMPQINNSKSYFFDISI